MSTPKLYHGLTQLQHSSIVSDVLNAHNLLTGVRDTLRSAYGKSNSNYKKSVTLVESLDNFNYALSGIEDFNDCIRPPQSTASERGYVN